MKKILNIILVLICACFLIGCKDNRRFISLVLEDGDPETMDLSAQTIRGIARALQPANDLVFTSADPTIATVDENGTVRAVSVGQTTVEVSDKKHPDVKKTLPVTVYSPFVHAPDPEPDPEADPEAEAPTREPDELDALLDNLSKVDESGLTQIVDHELYEKTVFKNGVQQTYGAWDQNLVASQDEAYFRIYETDGDTKTENGAMSFTDYEWIFYNNPYYDTYVFHQKGDVKNYYPVSMVEYMEEGNRTEPMLAILDNIFTSGRGVFTNTLENCTINSYLDLAIQDYSNVDKNGFGVVLDAENKPVEGEVFFDCFYYPKDDVADQDDESRYGIPYGTVMKSEYHFSVTIRDNKLVGYSNHVITTYEFGGDQYREEYDIDHLFERITDENKDQFIVYPDISQYTLVDYLFAI